MHRLCGGRGLASHLMDALLDLNIKGLPNSEYVFLNVDTGIYLYHENEELLNTETTDAGYREIIGRIKAEGSKKLSGQARTLNSLISRFRIS